MINNPQKYRNAIAEGKIYVTLKQYEIFVLIAERYVGLPFIFFKVVQTLWVCSHLRKLQHVNRSRGEFAH